MLRAPTEPGPANFGPHHRGCYRAIVILPVMIIIVSVMFVAAAVAASWYLSNTTVSPYEPMPMAHRIPFPRLALTDADAAIAQLDEPDEVVIPHVKALLVILL